MLVLGLLDLFLKDATILKLQCTVCQKTYPPDSIQYTCPACGEVGTLDVLYDYGKKDIVGETGDSKVVFTKEVSGVLAYMISNPEAKFRVSLLAVGAEATDGNLPDFGTYLGYVSGGLVDYKLSDIGLKLWASGTATLAKDYQNAKFRIGLSYPVDF